MYRQPVATGPFPPVHIHVRAAGCVFLRWNRCDIETNTRNYITDEFGRVALCSVLPLQLIACVMPGSRSSTDPEHKSPRESGEDSEDESEILEESPCGRWLKRREEVSVSFFHNNVATVFPQYLCFTLCLVQSGWDFLFFGFT